MDTIRCKPWGEGQGDHVIVNSADFDPAFHVLEDAEIAAPAAPAAPTKASASKKAAAQAAADTEG